MRYNDNSGTAYRRHLAGRSRQHSRFVADTASCDLRPKSVVDMLRLALSGALRFTQQSPRECRIANYTPEPINAGTAAEEHSLVPSFPNEAAELGQKRPSFLVAVQTAAECPAQALTNMPTPAAMVMGPARHHCCFYGSCMVIFPSNLSFGATPTSHRSSIGTLAMLSGSANYTS